MATQTNRQGNRRVTGQKPTSRSEDAIKRHIAQRAAFHLSALPNEASPVVMADKRVENLLVATRNFLVDCTSANRWTMKDVVARGRVLELVEAALEYGMATTKQAQTQQEGCGRAKVKCRRICDTSDPTYLCYWDCRTEYVVCLISSVLKTKA